MAIDSCIFPPRRGLRIGRPYSPRYWPRASTSGSRAHVRGLPRNYRAAAVLAGRLALRESAQALSDLIDAQHRQLLAVHRRTRSSFAPAVLARSGSGEPGLRSGPGVKFYTHLSDQFGPFHAKVIAATAGRVPSIFIDSNNDRAAHSRRLELWRGLCLAGLYMESAFHEGV